MSRTAEPSWTGTISTAAAPDSTAAEVTDDSIQGSIRIIGSSRRNLGAGKQGPAGTPEDLPHRGRSRTGALPGGPGRGRARSLANPRRRQRTLLGRRQGSG